MTEQHIRIPMPDGEADAILFKPDSASGEPLPGVIDLPDIGGIRDASMRMSRRLAGEGYLVLLPNPFYRVSAPPVFSFPMNFTEPRTQQRFAELVKPLTPDAIHADGRAYVAALDQNGAAPGPIAILGHCFTGALALRTAAALLTASQPSPPSTVADSSKLTTRLAPIQNSRRSRQHSTSATPRRTAA